MDALHTSILRFVLKVSYRKSNFPSWVSKELINLIHYKNKLHATFKSSFDPLDYKVFSITGAKCKYLSRQCHRAFAMQTENSIIKDPNKFWDFIRKSRSDNTVPKSLSLNGVLSSSEQTKESVNLFATHFSSVYTILSTPIIPRHLILLTINFSFTYFVPLVLESLFCLGLNFS